MSGRGPHLLAVGVIVAFFDAFGIGANDVSNSLATAVNSGVLTMTQAAVAAPLFEFIGAVTAGGRVSGTISKGILSASLYTGKEGLLQVSFVCALLASSIWLQIANRYALPVSTTHSIIGATIGVGVAAYGVDAVRWGFSKPKVLNGVTLIPTDGFGPIWVSWFASPVVAGVFAAVQFLLTKWLVLEDNALNVRVHKHSFWRAVYIIPFFYGFVAAILVLLLAYKGVSADSNASDLAKVAKDSEDLALACCVTAIVVTLLSTVWVSWWQVRTTWNGEDLKWYEWLYHPLIAKRPARPGFDITHHDWEATRAAEKALADADKEAAAAAGAKAMVIRQPAAEGEPQEQTGEAKEAAVAVTVTVPAEDAQDPTPARQPSPTGEHATAGTLAAVADKLFHTPELAAPTETTLEQRVVKVVPKEITAAQAIAADAGYIIREMTETEKVLAEYKKTLTGGTLVDKLLLPVRFLCCFGIQGADGKEREIRTFMADDPHIKAMHASATHFDPHTEQFFMQLQIMTSLLALFAHGSNDTANAIGPFATIYGVYAANGSPSKGWPTETWMLAFGGASIGLGFLMYGYHLMRSLGNHLTFITPSRGYCMEFGASITVILASQIGLPISTTQCITGATIFVGALGGRKAVNWWSFAKIFGGWILTIPLVAIWAGLVLSFVIYSPTLKCPKADVSCNLVN